METNEINRGCYYYNSGNNPNFEYLCPTVYGARCEHHSKFFSAYTLDPDTKEYVGLDPDCSKCENNPLEERVK